jgi:hypothetical protein
MKDKYKLSDKFALITFILCPENADQDIEEFKKLNNERNSLLHGQDVIEATCQ